MIRSLFCILLLLGVVNALSFPKKLSFHAKSKLPNETPTSLSAMASKELIGTPGKVLCGTAMMFITWRWIASIFWNPSRKYDRSLNTVGREYDAWTTEGILEHYWGEHIHLGYYDNLSFPPKKDFKQAKYDFVDEMLKFANVEKLENISVLDVGCGIGGCSRHIAQTNPKILQVTGITLSPAQVARAQQLTNAKNISNVQFTVMDALEMKFPSNTFDLVWACESGEHMPDKEKYVQEMVRVLKPGGKLVIATWCQRDDRNKPFTEEDKKMLQFLYDEWTHPHFVSIEKYSDILTKLGSVEKIVTEDWTKHTLPSWLHSVWVGVLDPGFVLKRPKLWYKTVREAITLARMHHAFKTGLMQYGMITATKR